MLCRCHRPHVVVRRLYTRGHSTNSIFLVKIIIILATKCYYIYAIYAATLLDSVIIISRCPLSVVMESTNTL